MAGLFHVARKQHNPLGSAVQTAGSGRYTFGLALSAGLAGLLYGYDTVSVSGAIEFLDNRYALGTMMEGLVISSIIIGAVIGAASAGFISDRFGRKRILVVGGVIYFFAAIWSACTFTPYDLITARIIGGYGIGLTAALAVTYITESAPTAIRGTLAFSYQMLTVCGIILTNVTNYVIASYGTYGWDLSTGWRWMLGLGGVPAVIFVAAMWHAPESPRYLIQRGRTEEGFTVLEQIVGTQKARVRTDDIQASVKLEQTMSNEFTSLFRPGLRKALLIGIFLAVFNQAIGMNAISYYGPVMFSRMGFGGDTEFLAAACVGGVELAFTVVGLYLIDAVGRKRLMTVGSLLMVLFAVGIAGSYFAGRPLLTLVCVMLFTAAFAVSMGPIPWIVIPELFPTFLRGRATGLCVMCLLFVNGLIAQFTPLMIDHLGGGVTFAIFAGIDLLCFIGVIILVPETMGRTLEEIDRMWQPHTELAAAHYALSSADANIRHARATLARIENERMQAMGILDAAQHARLDAQQRIFAAEAQQRERKERLEQEAVEKRRKATAQKNVARKDTARKDAEARQQRQTAAQGGQRQSRVNATVPPVPLPGSAANAAVARAAAGAGAAAAAATGAATAETAATARPAAAAASAAAATSSETTSAYATATNAAEHAAAGTVHAAAGEVNDASTAEGEAASYVRAFTTGDGRHGSQSSGYHGMHDDGIAARINGLLDALDRGELGDDFDSDDGPTIPTRYALKDDEDGRDTAAGAAHADGRVHADSRMDGQADGRWDIPDLPDDIHDLDGSTFQPQQTALPPMPYTQHDNVPRPHAETAWDAGYCESHYDSQTSSAEYARETRAINHALDSLDALIRD
ncbi:sugar porter family MFS transporter [Bifidobacterium leontopitheci]|uniref:Sugar transporter n=1 Tax=Bifidobacterium leontopitheci TaxID=2650774 RepID=A0A6I1GVA6_9BIFI|nr:sugar porter family MFS transporter [Bifidobacterium leontopitheci]KAB7790391.1 sugar transporter [Bifidobacterium leontopitheci]